MTADDAQNTTLPGALLEGLRVGFGAALVFGLVDALLALTKIEEPVGFVGFLGGAAAAVLVYAGVYGALGVVATIVSWPLFGRSPARVARTAALVFSAGLFLEIYWWTREYVFWGYPALSPERLGAAAVMAVAALGLAFGLVAVLGRPLAGLARLSTVATILVALGGAAFLWSERSLVTDRSQGAVGERNDDLPNVLLIVVDALRPDVIATYGSEIVETPVMDRIADEGVLFENAFVQAPFTWSSFGSILTGKYPRRHGMLKLQAGFSWIRHLNATMPLHLKTAQREDGGTLTDEDWVATAFMTGAVTRDSGLMAGVDIYCEAMLGHELVHRSSRWSRFSSDLLLFHVWNKATQQVDYNKAGSTAVEWLAENAGDRRFFGFLHLYSTHTPYDPAPEFREKYVDPNYDGPIQAFTAMHRIAIEHEEYVLTEADAEQIRNLYYGGTAQADRAIGLVMDELERQGVLDDTILIVTSDHGEELGEHGLWEHNWMYQTNLRIPLLVRWPEKFPAGRRVEAMVETVDILPTICDAMGLELPVIPDTDDAPYHQVDGVSLLPLVRGDVDRVKDFTFAESGPSLSVQDERWKLVVSKDCLELPMGDPGWAKAARTPQLYDLRIDPDEYDNRFEHDVAEAERLLAVLREWDASLPLPKNAVVNSDRDKANQDVLQSLADLGYLGDTGDGGDIEPIQPATQIEGADDETPR